MITNKIICHFRDSQRFHGIRQIVLSQLLIEKIIDFVRENLVRSTLMQHNLKIKSNVLLIQYFSISVQVTRSQERHVNLTKTLQLLCSFKHSLPIIIYKFLKCIDDLFQDKYVYYLLGKFQNLPSKQNMCSGLNFLKQKFRQTLKGSLMFLMITTHANLTNQTIKPHLNLTILPIKSSDHNPHKIYIYKQNKINQNKT